MNDASLYSQYNSLQKNDASFVIDNYFRLIKWQHDENILDVGSGDGGVTLDLLLPKLPKNFNNLIGSDISEEMVRFAKNKCQNRKIDFVHLDISTVEIPTEFAEYFHHIFSFYCLHWVLDQRQALKNIFEMLKPGGDTLLMFLASTPTYDIYEKMAKSNKWAPYMSDYKKYVSPYHYVEDPVKEVESLLKREGFTSHLCRIEERTYIFPNFAVLSKSVLAINPFVKKLPENEVDNYIADYIKEVKKLENVKIETCSNNNEERIHVPNKVFITYASKPL